MSTNRSWWKHASTRWHHQVARQGAPVYVVQHPSAGTSTIMLNIIAYRSVWRRARALTPVCLAVVLVVLHADGRQSLSNGVGGLVNGQDTLAYTRAYTTKKERNENTPTQPHTRIGEKVGRRQSCHINSCKHKRTAKLLFVKCYSYQYEILLCRSFTYDTMITCTS